jgi:lipid-A-disaccharide synthase
VFFVAGEVSGDIQAALLIHELTRRDPSLAVVGVGGARMTGAGATLLFDSSDWGVIGHLAPLLRAPQFLRTLRAVTAAVRRVRPHLLVLVDFPGFNLRLAAALRTEVPLLYYFPPMVSVRKGDRARRVASLGARLLATLPFEAAAYEAAGADVTFVGHPAVDTVHPRWEPGVRRSRLGLSAGSRVVGLLPGSRTQEIALFLPMMLDAAATLARRHSDLEFVLPVAAAHLRADVDRCLERAALPVRITSDVYDAMAEATVLTVASGSATLEAALLGAPMVVVYRLPWLSALIASSLLKARVVSLPNLLAGRQIVTELLQAEMTPERIARQTDELLGSPARRAVMAADLRAAAARLGPPGAVRRAADEILRMLG